MLKMVMSMIMNKFQTFNKLKAMYPFCSCGPCRNFLQAISLHKNLISISMMVTVMMTGDNEKVQ